MVVVGGGGGVIVSSSADVEKDHGIALSEVLLNRPADGICVLVREVDCYADFAKGAGGWRLAAVWEENRNPNVAF